MGTCPPTYESSYLLCVLQSRSPEAWWLLQCLLCPERGLFCTLISQLCFLKISLHRCTYFSRAGKVQVNKTSDDNEVTKTLSDHRPLCRLHVLFRPLGVTTPTNGSFNFKITNAASKETKSQLIDRNQRPKYIHALTAYLLANSSCQHGITHPPLPNPENKSTYRGLSDTDNYIKRRYIPTYLYSTTLAPTY
ncbi:uncharacterized protein B0T23DRAFT_169895 [Neurospora hispaniola]|uniref:Uncharacterized protein n=1 Tax=Neurospora hispaniola TaxID=588809 RepID=A0AAJ0I666_9PEZI|nr:hypothetical protein B0T23DRAFT_169895 [Neurospora hispaniola]